MLISAGAFDAAISSWQSFYMLAGSAAATLLGLVFVSVSLHIDLFSKARESADIRVLADWTFINFIMILSFSFIFLIPSEDPMGIGVPLLLLGMMELGRTIILWERLGFKNRSDDAMLESSFVRWSLLIPNTICYIALIYVAVAVMSGDTGVLNWMVLVILYLIISAARNAWSLMMKVAEIKAGAKK